MDSYFVETKYRLILENSNNSDLWKRSNCIKGDGEVTINKLN